jgi:hypothetical protein
MSSPYHGPTNQYSLLTRAKSLEQSRATQAGRTMEIKRPFVRPHSRYVTSRRWRHITVWVTKKIETRKNQFSTHFLRKLWWHALSFFKCAKTDLSTYVFRCQIHHTYIVLEVQFGHCCTYVPRFILLTNSICMYVAKVLEN